MTPLSSTAEKELRSRMPRLQTAQSGGRSPGTTDTPQMSAPLSAVTSADPPAALANHRRFLLTDHVAMRYLVEDSSVTLLAHRQQLEGYELYLVEQWACSRKAATFIITTYTGDPKDKVWASIIGVPQDESAWSSALKTYFKALQESQVRPKETSLGTLMITNLSGFPSKLTVIPIPNGDVREHRVLFYVNENLKRLGCSGRSGIKLAPPSSATVAKFHQLYRTSDKIPLDSAVIELVKLCQVALVMFGVLEPEFADGLLCDVTEAAINDWWREFGNEYYTVEPRDGILGPTTVAAILGILMGARNRLSAYNAPVSKDVFDIDATKRAIGYFQKTQRIERTRRLDRETLQRLRRATAKAASKEGWRMPTALKSTVAELSGKGGEMVLGMVGGDKAGIAEIETTDIDRFVELLRGERARWLWHGKPRKAHSADMFSRLPGEDGVLSPTEPETAIVKLMKRESTLEAHKLAKRNTSLDEERPNVGVYQESLQDAYSTRAVIKRATGKIESGSGLNRIKDAVGRKNHQAKPSSDEITSAPPALQQIKSDPEATLKEVATSPHLPRSSKEFDYEPSLNKTMTEIPKESANTSVVERALSTRSDGHKVNLSHNLLQEPEDSDLSKPGTVDNSIAGSIYRDIDNIEKLPFAPTDTAPMLLRRTQSSDQMVNYHADNRHDKWWPRHLSFSIAEDSVLRWSPVIAVAPPEDEDSTGFEAPLDLTSQLEYQESLSFAAKHLAHQLSILQSTDEAWTSARITYLNELAESADADIQELEELYIPKLDTYNSLHSDTHEIISRERLQLQEQIRDLETLGAKLEYEINTLRGKVDDVDDGVVELERQVEGVEARTRELDLVLGVQRRESWWGWGFRWLVGLR